MGVEKGGRQGRKSVGQPTGDLGRPYRQSTPLSFPNSAIMTLPPVAVGQRQLAPRGMNSLAF